MVRESLVRRFAVGVALASAMLVTATAIAVARPAIRARLGFTAAAYAAAQHVDLPSDVYDSSPYTLILFARSTCPACQRSSLLFKQLVAEANTVGVASRLVSGVPVAAEEMAYARGLGLTQEEVVGVDLQKLRVRLVPTIVLVDRRGEIHYAWEGAVPVGQQADLLRRMTSLSRAR